MVKTQQAISDTSVAAYDVMKPQYILYDSLFLGSNTSFQDLVDTFQDPLSDIEWSSSKVPLIVISQWGSNIHLWTFYLVYGSLELKGGISNINEISILS